MEDYELICFKCGKVIPSGMFPFTGCCSCGCGQFEYRVLENPRENETSKSDETEEVIRINLKEIFKKDE